MHTMDHHLSNGDAAAVEIQSRSGPETSYDIPTAKRLPYNVVFCSGQDEDYPATELNNGVISRGWQSSRFCYFPQEIVLELQWPSRIINMQLLCHEIKIPTKVEVFVGLIVPYVQEAIGQMKRLGYVALDCNERCGYQARELKSVYIDSPATVVRLVFHNCHCNDFNAYNQVGLMALILTGEPLDEQQWTLLTQPGFEDLLQTPRNQSRNCKPAELKMQSGSSGSSAERKCDVDLSTAHRILQLQAEKNSAVLGEDYDEAKRLKGLIDRLKLIGEEIKQLENRKQLAVENEDYDTAKSCKKEIEKLRLQEQVSDNNIVQAEKGGEVSDCGVSSDESVDEVAHAAAEGSSQSEDPSGREDSAGTDCDDSEKKEFGTQTLHPVKTTTGKKLDKEISCKTPDLRPPPQYRPGAHGKKSETKPGLLSVVFPWWRPKNAPKSPPRPTNGKPDDAFIPAITAPNMLPSMNDDAIMHVLPTVSYNCGSSALLPMLTRPMYNTNGLHPLFNQNASTIMAMTMNDYPSKKPLISTSEHPQAVLKTLPNFFNQNAQAPPSPVKNAILYQNYRGPMFPTPSAKNVNFLSPMLYAPTKKQTSPIKDENMECEDLNQCEMPYSCGEQPSSKLQDGMNQNNEEQARSHDSNHKQNNLNSRFGALVKDYNEARNMAEQITRVQNNGQDALHTRFGTLVKEFNEARNLAVIQSDEKKLRNRNRSHQQALRDQDYEDQVMVNDGSENEDLSREQSQDYHNQVMNHENGQQISNVYDNGHQRVLEFQSNDELSPSHNRNHEHGRNNNYMPKMQNNLNGNMMIEEMQKVQTSSQVQRRRNQLLRVQLNGDNQMRSFQDIEQIQRPTQNDCHDQDKTYAKFDELSKMHRNGTGYDQIKAFLNSDDAKVQLHGAFGPLNGLSSLSGLTPGELKIKKENELFAEMENNYQQKKNMDARSERDDEALPRGEKKNYEENMKAQAKADVFNNDEEVIKVHNKNTCMENNSSGSQNHGEYESNSYQSANSTSYQSANSTSYQSTNSTTYQSTNSTPHSNEYNSKYISTSNQMALLKQQQNWSPQMNKEENDPPSKPFIQRNLPRKLKVDQPSSPKKAHLSIKERIAQAAQQAIDDLVPEPLTESQMSESAALLKLIDVYYVQCLYSKEWKLRDKAMNYMVQEIKNEKVSGDALDIFRIMSKVTMKGLNDKVSNVFNIALQLSRVFITKYASGVPSTDLRNCVNDLINILLEKLGDSNIRTKDAATEALMFLANRKEIGLPIIANPLLKPLKNQTIWRPILGRLQLILIAIPIYGLHPPNKMGLQTEPLMFFIVQAFNNANGDVRNIAVKIITEVYRLMGSPVEKYLKNVKPVVREVLTRNFEKISQEVRCGQGNIQRNDSSSKHLMPPLQCNPKLLEFNHDEKRVGSSKECKNVVGKTTLDSSNNNDSRCVEDD